MSRYMTVRGHLLAHDPEQNKYVGDHDGREELEEVLDPQVDDPEPPEIRRREVRLRSGEQPDGVERRDRKGGEEEQPRHVAHVLAPQPPAHRPKQHHDPEKEAYGEQDLPEATEVQVLEALVAEPGPKVARESEDPRPLPDEAPEDDYGQSA
jgi:hypothetical protein